MDALVDQRTAPVERTRASPARAGVVLGRTIPLDPRRGEQRASERARPQQRPKPHERRLRPVLEQNAETHARCARRGDQAVGRRYGDIDWLLHQHVQPCFGGTYALIRVHPRRAADDHGVERAMGEQGRQFVVRHTTIQLGQPRRAGVVGPVHRDDLDAGNLATGARVRLADVAGADECNVRHGAIMHHSWRVARGPPVRFTRACGLRLVPASAEPLVTDVSYPASSPSLLGHRRVVSTR